MNIANILGTAALMFGCCFSACRKDPTVLEVSKKQITVNGKTATIYAIEPLDLVKRQTFNVRVENKLNIPTAIHWHGLIAPNSQDGAAYITQLPVYPQTSYSYEFLIKQAGTYWMHAHFELQEQNLLAAPLILHDPQEEKLADEEAVIFFSDFSFKSPLEIFENLKKSPDKKMDLFDVSYDAFLANWHTLSDPYIKTVKPGTKVRLRIINGSSATNFFVSLGLEGTAIAIDGNRIQPVKGSHFELAAAQRIDVIVTIPQQGGAFPVLAQGQGTNMQTGIILATASATIPQFSEQTTIAGALTNSQEHLFEPLTPLEKKTPDQQFTLELNGNMMDYVWTINNQIWPNITPLVIEEGKRIEITFVNKSEMSHPMHLHGHVFQLTALNGKPLNGPLRDTINVPAHSTATIQFDANNPGIWPLHCHILYHMQAGMMTVVRYNTKDSL